MELHKSARTAAAMCQALSWVLYTHYPIQSSLCILILFSHTGTLRLGEAVIHSEQQSQKTAELRRETQSGFFHRLGVPPPPDHIKFIGELKQNNIKSMMFYLIFYEKLLSFFYKCVYSFYIMKPL